MIPRAQHHYTILYTVDGNVHGISISDSNIAIVSKLFKNVSVDLVILLENYSYKNKAKRLKQIKIANKIPMKIFIIVHFVIVYVYCIYVYIICV